MDVEIRTIDGHTIGGEIYVESVPVFVGDLAKDERGYLVIHNANDKAVAIKKTAIASIVQL